MTLFIVLTYHLSDVIDHKSEKLVKIIHAQKNVPMIDHFVLSIVQPVLVQIM